MPRMRTVVEATAVSDQIDAAIHCYPRLDEAFDALKWWLSHQPEAGELLDDCHWIFRQQSSRNPGVPALVTLYTFDDNQVEMLAIAIHAPS